MYISKFYCTPRLAKFSRITAMKIFKNTRVATVLKLKKYITLVTAYSRMQSCRIPFHDSPVEHLNKVIIAI